MTTKEDVHQLVDELPPGQLVTAQRFLEYLRDREGTASRTQGAALGDLLASWIEGDTQEQSETGEFLIRALDEDRLSDRKLFPEQLKGITW